MPPLLSSRDPGLQVVLGNVVPCVFGLITGILLGINEIAYIVANVLGILGGYGAGLEHRDGSEGALRGVAGGAQFGIFILLGHEISGLDAEAHLPEPQVLLVVLTTFFGGLLGGLGGRARRKRLEAEEAAPPPVDHGISRSGGGS